jgi:hypothetical protein
MLQKRNRLLCLFTLAISLVTLLPLHSQEAKPKATRQSSMDAFEKGDYEKAFGDFSELLVTFPKDPLYKYYSGVCLVKLNHDPENAVLLLKEALKGSSVARMVPADALYWHARALQLSGRYREAVAEFTEFSEQSGKKISRELGVPDFIQQCDSGKGEIMAAAAKITKTVPNTDAVKEKEKPGIPKDTLTAVKSFAAIPEQMRLPEKYDSTLSEGMILQTKADSLYRSVDSKKLDMEKLSYRDRTDLKAKITLEESQADIYQKQADKKFTGVQTAMNNITPAIPVEIAARVTEKKDTVVREPIRVISKDSVVTKKQPALRDSVRIVQNNFQQAFSFFEANSKSVSPEGKAETDPVIPPGLIYRIQIAVFRNPVTLSYFKGLSPVYGFKVAGTDKTTYYAGMFRRSADAARALTSVRQKGFKDAFTVALLDGKQVSADRAALLEKEWGKKTFRIAAKTGLQVVADTVPPTLSFRIEILRTEKPVKAEQMEDMKRVAGSRGLDMEKLPDGTMVYLAGKFITYESAEDYAGLLSKNGYRDAKVTAWLGSKQIPVETARQLFENLE